MSEFEGQTVLVTGATGFLGGAVARRLADEGAQVKALARRTGRDAYIRDVANIEVVMGDITDAERMIAVTEGCDYVFHVAAALNGPLSKQLPVNVDGTANVARAAVQAGVKRLVHVSTIATYGYTHRGVITEETPQLPGDVPYNSSKLKAEEMLIALAQELGLSYSIQRPGMIYGPRSGAWTTLFYKLAARRPTIFVGDGSGTSYAVYVDDVVDLLLLQAMHPAAEGEAFNCVSKPLPTFRDFIGGYMQLAGHDRWLGIPVPIVRLLAPLLDAYFRIRGEPQDVIQLLDHVLSDNQVSVDKARDLLGWEPQVCLDEGIQRCVPYLREIGLLS